MVADDGAAIRVRSQQVGGEEERRGEERRAFWVLLRKYVCSAKRVGANRISP